MATSKSKKMTMKLLINKKTNKIVYAEANKDCVDFLFHVFVLPVGSAVKHLLNDATTTVNGGSLGNLYKSVALFDKDLINPNVTTDCLLNPMVTKNAASRVSGWFINLYTEQPKTFYSCTSIHGSLDSVSDGKGVACSYCYLPMSRSLKYVNPIYQAGEGYVKESVPYMITDDLVVKPLTSKSSFTVLLELQIMDLSSVEEKEVTLDNAKAMALLKASLISKTVLTDTFLVKEEVQ